MYNVTENYKTSMAETVRNPSYLKITFGIISQTGAESSVISANSNDIYSTPNNIDISTNVVDKIYAKLLPNNCVLDGNTVMLPESNFAYQGYSSVYYSSDNGTFLNVPKLTIEFSEPFAAAGLIFTFDALYDNYPTNIRVLCYNDGVLVDTITDTPNSSQYVFNKQIPSNDYADKIEIEFLSTNYPNRNIRLSNIVFGIFKSFGNNDIETATFEREVDTLTSKLPKETFSFTIYDENNLYNPENPTGIWRYLENGQTIEAQLGYELNDGEIEWVQMCKNVVNGEVKSESNGAINKTTFSTTSLLGFLDNKYYKGVYSSTPASLYDLAIAILEDSDLPLDDSGNVRYEIDSSLQNITTSMPLPVDSAKNLLQLIANAGMCLLYTDRNGKIIIKPADLTLDTDFKYDFNNIYGLPVLNKYPALKNVVVTYNNVSVESGNSELLKIDVEQTDDAVFEFDYSAATNISLSVSSGLTITTSPVYYAQRCVVGLSGSGTVTINGNKIVTDEQTYTQNFNEMGEDCPVNNKIITTLSHAKTYGNWVAGYVQMRNEYTIEDRGYPEIDCGDVVLADTNFSTNSECLIAQSNIEFNGAIKGKTKYYLKEGV